MMGDMEEVDRKKWDKKRFGVAWRGVCDKGNSTVDYVRCVGYSFSAKER